MDSKHIQGLIVGAALGAAIGYAMSGGPSAAKESEDDVVKVVRAFLDAQSERNLDKMCSLVDENILYINEPHPMERAIRGRQMFRDVFAESPCIWCEKANLQVLQLSHQPGSDTVFVERHDQFFVDGHWLGVPICGYLKVKNNKVVLWKDYWDYTKYRKFVEQTYGPDFRLFRKTLKQ